MCLKTCAHAQSLSCVQLFVTPRTVAHQGSYIHGIFQARILERVAIHTSSGTSLPKNQTCVSCIGRWIFYHWATWEVPPKTWVILKIKICIFWSMCVHAWSVVSIISNSLWPYGCNPSYSSVHGILQARLREWVAMPFSRGSSWFRDGTRVSCTSCITGSFFTAEPLGKPHSEVYTYFFATISLCTFSRSALFYNSVCICLSVSIDLKLLKGKVVSCFHRYLTNWVCDGYASKSKHFQN